MSELYTADGQWAWKKLFGALMFDGKECLARGTKSREIENYVFEIDPITEKFCLQKARGLSFKYLAGELAWYLRGDRNDLAIEEYSSFWKTVKNKEEPYYNSNYGHYYFTEGQFNYVIECLANDKMSRQACIMINNRDVTMSNSTDKLCTNAVMFRIRDGRLNMTVQMRSNDAVFGLGIDAALFSIMHEILFCLLQFTYPTLRMGTYFHTSGSMHIYERHYDMAKEIIMEPPSNYRKMLFPRINGSGEALYLLHEFPKGEIEIRNLNSRITAPDGFAFTQALYSALAGVEPYDYLSI